MAGHYERLSSLDASFLALESATTHMHVAGIAIFEAGPLQRADGGIDIDRIRAFIESKLSMIPRYRQRLAFVPFERHPVWVDDAHFNLEYHIRHTSLPEPGTEAQLRSLAARLVSQQLDRAKPLWELNVVEGLEDDRFAIVSKIHHCMIDGIAGVDLLAVILNLMPVSEIEPAEPFVPRPEPAGSELVVRETARRVGRVVGAARSVRTLVSDAQEITGQVLRRARAVGYSLSSGWLTRAPKTPINDKVTPNRRFAVLDTDLAEVKEIKNRLGGTVNDVILATVAGGIRRFFEEVHDFRVADAGHFRAMAPVSVRPKHADSALGNHVAMWLVSLPITVSDPAERLARVAEETNKLKLTDQALGASTLVQISTGAPATLLSLASRLAQNARPFNLTVTNVPGPQFPLFMLEAPLVAQYPLVPLWESHGVGIALFSYLGRVFWGFNADWDVMPDVDEFVRCIDEAFGELLEAARSADTAIVGERAPARKPKSRPPLGGSGAKPRPRPPLDAEPAASAGSVAPTAEKPASKGTQRAKKAPAKQAKAK
jgi:WS/DGAT/MGAT family acyltransferase